MLLFKRQNKSVSWILPLLAMLCLATGLQGQAQPEIVKTELLTVSFNGLLAPGLYYRNGGEVVQLSAGSQGVSPPIFYQGPRQLALYKSEADLNPPEKGKEPVKPLLMVSIPKNSDRVLLVFAFSKKSKTPQVKAYGIDDKSFKEGDYRIFNFSNRKVFLNLQDKKLAVEPGKTGEVKNASWSREIGSVTVSVGTKMGEDVKPVYSSVWGHRPERRSFLFVFESGEKARPLKLKKFYDVPSFKSAGRRTSEKG